jgi:TRAP-type C4-dicarboxylate transport system permease small subunit
MDMMLKAAGASVISLPSNEIYAAMQTGAMDAAMTSSTSFISFKLEEIAKHLTSGRNKAYWFMFEPLLMSKEVFAKLPKAQQDIIMQAGAEQEKFATDAARADDKIAADVYAKAGAKVYDLDEATVRKWQVIARDTGVEGLRRARRDLGGAAQGGAKADRVSDPGGGLPHGAGADAALLAGGASLLPESAETGATPGIDPSTPRALLPLARALAAANRVMVGFGMLALLAASLVLTSSVVTRYLFKSSTDWQDETAVFLLVGATFLCGAFVQSIRGHVGIEAVSTLLSRKTDALRASASTCSASPSAALFAWKSWTLLHEAWVDKQTTSSSWAPPLWIPYLLMSLGMTLLSLQLIVHVAASVNRARAIAAGDR